MTGLKTWGLQFLISAVAFIIFFGMIVGKRGADLIVFVVVLSVIGPTIYWLRARSRNPSRS
jgi:hypothetical protein